MKTTKQQKKTTNSHYRKLLKSEKFNIFNT